ncbi:MULTISPECIES: hypothetical protein [Paenibacillus]|uniref:hypothetical protein n=1 Tax=Paenibacillus TaxID=44249 RepID=UPI0022B8A422|nr:hypothetical protein [Paenibacillus caseinilyticus]MCZ8520909.1 hypothetical protein [Paenibacillus caseinilyticus]
MNRGVFFVFSLLVALVAPVTAYFRLIAQLVAGMLVPEGVDNVAGLAIVIVVIPLFFLMLNAVLYAVLYYFAVAPNRDSGISYSLLLPQKDSPWVQVVRGLGYVWLVYLNVEYGKLNIYPLWIWAVDNVIVIHYIVWTLRLVKDKIKTDPR